MTTKPTFRLETFERVPGISGRSLLRVSGWWEGEPPATELLVDTGDDADRGEDRTVLATDARYTTQAAAQTPDLPVLVERACAPALVLR